ncbi:MAG: L,D-transpeptidase family protein [Stappiaceae bacterium]
MISRRNILCGSLLPLIAPKMAWAQAAVAKPVTDLRPGEWTWFPERAPDGPVVVIVSLSDQLAYVYRNGIRVGVSTVSSGKQGFETPEGVFTVLRKEKLHRSHKYHNAAMPDSQFFFGGAALHAGGLPGYPSSHGCVHLPRPFADALFQITHNGTPVIVTSAKTGIGQMQHAGIVLSNNDLKQIETFVGNVKSKSLPQDSQGKHGAFSLLVSGADRQLYGIQDGEIVLNAPIGVKRSRWPLGAHVYVLQGFNDNRSKFDWIAIGLGSNQTPSADQQKELAATFQLVIPPEVYSDVASRLHPGSTFMLTDLPAHPATRTGQDFLIMRDTGRG